MPVQVRYTWNQKALQSLLESPSGPVCQHLTSLATQIVADARDQVGVESGHLKAAITFRPDFGHVDPFVRIGVFEVGAPGFGDLGYGYFHHEGTKGGTIITPKKGRYLVWTDKSTGRKIFATRVVRGDTPANHYLTDPLARLGFIVRRVSAGSSVPQAQAD